VNILMTGGAGYIGSVLTEKLLRLGHRVTVLDSFWFGDYLGEHSNLRKISDDVRNIKLHKPYKYDVVFHFAAVANDPCTSLDPALSWSISCESSYLLADSILRAGSASRVIYASSGSVYGIKQDERVTEELELVPISTYNRAKIVSERIFLSFQDKLPIQIVRPATVCGLSPRMRLDVAVNMLTMQALKNGEILVLGGDQYRPNIHIDDLTDLYIYLLDRPELTGIYNAGFENITIKRLAELISEMTGARVVFEASNDLRSYRVDSTRILEAGFSPKRSIRDAIIEIRDAYRSKLLKDMDVCYNVNWMRGLMAQGSILK